MNDDVVIVDEGNEISLIVRTADQTRKAEISVPTETTVLLVAINTFDFIFLGQGASTSEVFPFERFCKTCFILSF